MSIYGNLFNKTEQSLDFSLESYQLLLDDFMNECTLYDSLMMESSVISINEAFNKEAIKKKFNDMIEAIKKFLNNIYEFIKGVISKIKGKFTKKTYDNIDKQTEEIKKEMKEDDIKPEDIKIEPGKTAEQYEAEIEKLKEEIENMKAEEETNKQQDSQSSSNNSRYTKLAMKRNEMQVLKIQKAISTILDNDLLYFNPKCLLKCYIISLDNYKNKMMKAIDDIENFNKYINPKKNNEDGGRGEVANLLTTLVQPEVLALDENKDKKFDYGGFDHTDLNKYVNQCMEKSKKESKISDLEKFLDKDLVFINSDVVHLERLLIDIRDIIGILINKFNSMTGSDFNNIYKNKDGNGYIEFNEYKDDEPKKLNDEYVETFNLLKNYINQLKTACQVITVAIKFEGQHVGAYKSALSAIKALI